MASQYFDEAAALQYSRFQFNFGVETLRGRVIVLAGGAGGLGAAAAALLVAEGAIVVAGYRRNQVHAAKMKEALKSYGDGQVALCRADIREAKGRNKLLAAGKKLGPLFGLVVFAGDPARGDTEEVFRSSLEINYLAPILLARQAAEEMRAASTPGSIVLFSSMQGGYTFENSSAYAPPKAALVHAAKILAKESGGNANIRVNVVAPGATMAGMAQASLRTGKYDGFIAGRIIPRFGRAEDIARTVRFLLEPDSYVTGQVITVDGGLTLRRDVR